MITSTKITVIGLTLIIVSITYLVVHLVPKRPVEIQKPVRTRVLNECAKCGHMHMPETSKQIVAWVDWDRSPSTNTLCKVCAPAYDAVEYLEGQYQSSPDGRWLIGGRASRYFKRNDSPWRQVKEDGSEMPPGEVTWPGYSRIWLMATNSITNSIWIEK